MCAYTFEVLGKIRLRFDGERLLCVLFRLFIMMQNISHVQDLQNYDHVGKPEVYRKRQTLVVL